MNFIHLNTNWPFMLLPICFFVATNPILQLVPAYRGSNQHFKLLLMEKHAEDGLQEKLC